MAQNKQEWEELGQHIQDIIDYAVNSRDFRKMNQSVTRVVGKAVDVGTGAVRKVADAAAQEKKKNEIACLYANPKGKLAAGIAQTVGGALITSGSLVSMMGAAAIGMIFGFGAVGMGFSAIGTALGAAVLAGGIGKIKKVNRFKTYCKTLGQTTHCKLERLAQSVGKSVKFVRKEVSGMINDGLFLEGHLDHEENSLITSHETYRYYEQSRLLLEERKKQEQERLARNHTPEVQQMLDKGDAFVAQIRKCNDDIPGVEISRKISRIEDIVERIFDRAEEHPEILPDLKKMLDYYLPMTVKLLTAYADMDAQPVQGETIQTSKREIEETLDTLNLAFEKLMDELFKDTALDVSSDISVLNTLLAQEGLTDDELTKMKKENRYE